MSLRAETPAEDPIGYGRQCVTLGRAQIEIESSGGAVDIIFRGMDGRLICAPVRLLIWGDHYRKAIDLRGSQAKVVE